MVDTNDVVADLAAQIADLRGRIRELDDQRAKLSEQLEQALTRFSAAAHAGAPPPASIDPQILRVFHRFPDRVLSPRDVASALNYRDLPHLTMRLSRMVKAKKLKRVGHGRYVAS